MLSARIKDEKSMFRSSVDFHPTPDISGGETVYTIVTSSEVLRDNRGPASDNTQGHVTAHK